MSALARYDAACAALAEAVRADEVMHVRLEAEGLRALARVAKNVEMEAQAVSLRTRAEARLGEMLEAGEKQGVIARRGRQPDRKDSDAESLAPPATLKDIGVDPKLSARARKLSGIGAQAVDAMLSKMERESRERGKVAVNVIDAELGRRNAESRRNLARELSDASAALCKTGRKFPVLYADPAWQRKAGIGDRAYENSYVTMTWQEILAMPVADRLLPDAWGFIWFPRAHVLAAVECEIDTPLGRCTMKVPLAWAIQIRWGFDAYSTMTVWTKTDEKFPDDQGTGLVFYDQDEVLLVFKRGRGLPKPDTDKKHGSNHRERAGRHSAKPTYYRDMINDMTGGVPVLELFAREDEEHVLPPNFFTWGNQSKNSAEAPVTADGAPIEHDESGEVIESSDAQVIPHPENKHSPVLKEESEPEEDLSIPAFLRRPQPEVANG